MKAIRKALENKKSRLVRDIIELLIKGHNDKDICNRVGLNYHLYRYYLTNYNKELRITLSKARTMRRSYKHERTMRGTLRTMRRRDKAMWYKLL